jgi:antitoxin component of MazEF toxin-antitoxin module
MISADNIKELTGNNINYIVGARPGNISARLPEAVDKAISRKDGKSIRLETGNGCLIYSYSSNRYRQDLHEMNKQIEKQSRWSNNHPKLKN